MIDIQIIINIASIITALGIIFDLIFSVYGWYLKKEKNDNDIKIIKEEQIILIKSVLMCLKSLKEQEGKESIVETIANIENCINNQAHK